MKRGIFMSRQDILNELSKLYSQQKITREELYYIDEKVSEQVAYRMIDEIKYNGKSAYEAEQEILNPSSSRDTYSHTHEEEQETSHTPFYGMNQNQIDYEVEQDTYKTPSWYNDQQKEKEEYGLPSYARRDENSFRNPYHHDDEEEESTRGIHNPYHRDDEDEEY